MMNRSGIKKYCGHAQLRRGSVLVLAFIVFVNCVGWAQETTSDSSQTAVKPPKPGLLRVVSGIKDEANNYVLTVGDRVKITIYPEDEYIKGSEVEISTEGNVTIPIVGKIPVAGKTIIDAQREIARVLEDGYFVEPEVLIEVIKFSELQVVILGEVKKPGTYSFPPGSNRLTLLQAISMAGGFSDIANIKKIKIIRKLKNGRSKKINANADSIISGKDEDVELEAGDIIHVSESMF